MTRLTGSTQLAFLVATFGNVGRVPLIPGTFGTLAAVPFAFALALVGNPLAEGLALALLIPLGVWSAGVVEQYQEDKDPGLIVVDEVAGFFVAVAFHPPSLMVYFAAFFVFRILDILKPPPARWSEKFPGGLGVMADDLIVGVYTNLMLWGGIYLLNRI